VRRVSAMSTAIIVANFIFTAISTVKDVWSILRRGGASKRGRGGRNSARCNKQRRQKFAPVKGFDHHTLSSRPALLNLAEPA
jgi:hypothetical protein